MDRKPIEPKQMVKGKTGENDDEAGEATDEEQDKKRRSSNPSAAARRGGGGVACQAENCTVDLTEAKRYHRRHKVCEPHSKAPVVMVAGLRQRFCQQCSRFHELSEFDDTKRSCRRRLAGHNERRRKSSSESQGEGSNQCRQADQGGGGGCGGGSMQLSLPGRPAY